MAVVQIKRLSENATLPFRATPGSAGLDLFSAEDVTIEPDAQSIVKTDLAIKCPENSYIKLTDRSSMALQKLRVAAGTIDSDFMGNVCVILHNYGNTTYYVKKGQRICQMIVMPIIVPHIVEVNELTPTERGVNGFGSSGS